MNPVDAAAAHGGHAHPGPGHGTHPPRSGEAPGAHPAQRLEFAVEGMTCASCAARVERALKGAEGVSQATVNLATHRAVVHADPKLASALTRRVADAGYGLELVSGGATAPGADSAHAHGHDHSVSLVNLSGAAVLTAPVVAMHMLNLHFAASVWIQAALTAIVMGVFGRAIYAHAARLAWHGSANMDTLIALGTGAAFTYSFVTAALGSHEVYFETAAMTVTFILCGRFLEARAKHIAAEALRALMRLRPPKAHLVTPFGDRDIDVEQARPGDILLVRPGETFPVDGVLAEGTTEADESMITGEAMPVPKTEGDPVIGGTTNGAHSVKMRAQAVGADTVLQGMVRLVEEAQGSKAPIQHLADQVSAVFVPAILAVAGVTFALWYGLDWAPSVGLALKPAVAVLLIACPCALGLATPVAMMVASGRAAREGLIVRDVAALQRAGEVRAIVFDKTGTLTTGHPRVVTARLAPGAPMDESHALELLAAVEHHSAHPLARAIAAYAKERGAARLEATGVEDVVGRGVRGQVNGHTVIAGTPAYVGASMGAPEAFAWARDLPGTPVAVAIGGLPVAVFAVADEPRPEARDAIAALRALGVEPVIASGDHDAPVREIASALGIGEIHARVSPEDKLRLVQQLQARHGAVAMAGDGVNDAAALAAADVGIAMGTGTSVAQAAAPVTMAGTSLATLVRLIGLSRATMRTVRQNLWWAFGYNLIGVPLAMAGQLNPSFAATAMAVSSVAVVLNSLRLRG